MRLNLSKPVTYLITSGAATPATTPSTEDFSAILELVAAAVDAGVSLCQLREKNASARVLTELVSRAVALTRGSATKLLVNDRADIARAAGADGVHLTSASLRAATVRKTLGEDLLIGVSTHSLDEARVARDDGADFVVFGPVFETSSKQRYGEPQGVRRLERVIKELKPFPVIALGGVNLDNVGQCLTAGASGVAGISLFADPSKLAEVVKAIEAAEKSVSHRFRRFHR
jgi:thiamine-phosphate pyrophosphorylase